MAVAVLVLVACGSATSEPIRPERAPEPRQARTRQVVFTYDDLPASLFRADEDEYVDVTNRLVTALSERGVPAIGFVNEDKLEVAGVPSPQRIGLLEKWVEMGFELGNHTYSHPDLHEASLADYQADVLRGEVITRPILARAGRPLRFFRHPFLHTGMDREVRTTFESFLHTHGYRVAPVTIDNHEWIFARAYDHARLRGDEALMQRIRRAFLAYFDEVFAYYERRSTEVLGYEVPQILLLHANKLNADVVQQFIDLLAGRGYEFVSIDEAMQDPAYELADGYWGSRGISWIDRWALASDRESSFANEPPVPEFVQQVFDSPP